MSVQTQVRHVNDIEVAIAAILVRPDGSVVDLTLLTLYFKMVKSEGDVKVAETAVGVTVTDATAGKVQYDPVLANVNEEGVFHAYFVAIDGGGRRDTFPVKRGDFQIAINLDV